MGKPIIIFGTGNIADMAFQYATQYGYFVNAFTVSDEHVTDEKFNDRYVVPFSEIEKTCKPEHFDMFVAIGYNKMNHIRARFYHEAKAKGYNLVNIISPHAFRWSTATVGDNCFIFENNVIQHNVKIGNNVFLWSGNHIGHETVIQDHTYLASHVVVSGFCNIGKYNFIGVNATFGDQITTGDNTLIAAGTLVSSGTLSGNRVYHQITKGIATKKFNELSPKSYDMFVPPEEKNEMD